MGGLDRQILAEKAAAVDTVLVAVHEGRVLTLDAEEVLVAAAA